MSGSQTLLETQNLAIGYRGHTLVSGITAQLSAGAIVSLIGPNGVGKTTLFRTLLGLLPPVAGEVRLAGNPLSGFRRIDLAKRVAHVPQAEPSVFSFSVLDLVLMGRTAWMRPFSTPNAADQVKAQECLQKLGISHLSERDVSRLSGGQRQLVLIARALAQEASVLIMDEPTSSLDLGNAELVLRTLHVLADDGHAILVATHDPAHALRLGGHVLALAQDGKATFGTAAETVTSAFLSDLYGTPIIVERLTSGRAAVVPDVERSPRREPIRGTTA
jgi:iron complex transport system ATP-binding protein